MVQKYALKIAYDGTNYFGWQRQNGQITVQEQLEKALEELFQKTVRVTGASRTDTGVHALGQCASFDMDTKIPVEKIPYALNFFLPSDIVIQGASIVPSDFHPQYNAVEKTYIYSILNRQYPLPQYQHYAQHVYEKLDIEAMQKACRFFVGTHDFKSFCASGGTQKTTVRTIYQLSVEEVEPLTQVKVRGNGFLYNMVRIIVGTLLDVGKGKRDADSMADLILSKDRTKAGKTVEPQGLQLHSIVYKDIKF